MQGYGNINRQVYFEDGQRGYDDPSGYRGKTNYEPISEINEKALVTVPNNRNLGGYSGYSEPPGYACSVQPHGYGTARGHVPTDKSVRGYVVPDYNYRNANAVNTMSYERQAPSKAVVAKSTPVYFVEEPPRVQPRKPPDDNITVVKYGTAIPIIVTQYTPQLLPTTAYARPNFIPSFDNRKISYQNNKATNLRGTPGAVLPVAPYPNPHTAPFVRTTTTYDDSFNRKQLQLVHPQFPSYTNPYNRSNYHIDHPNYNPSQGNTITLQLPLYNTSPAWEVTTDPYGSTYYRSVNRPEEYTIYTERKPY